MWCDRCMWPCMAWHVQAWGESVGASDKVLMLADGNASLTRALGVELDLMDKGLGMRSRRWAMLVDDQVVKVRAWAHCGRPHRRCELPSCPIRPPSVQRADGRPVWCGVKQRHSGCMCACQREVGLGRGGGAGERRLICRRVLQAGPRHADPCAVLAWRWSQP